MSDFDDKSKAFCDWLKTNHATLSEGIALKDYRSEGAGRGLVATQDLEEGHVLFSIPRALLLSSATSELRKAKGMAEVLDGLSGWNPLILCMMYESQRQDSFWKPYFDVLPKEFSTPMFWPSSDLEMLEGTDILEKVGKEESEAMFHGEIEPIINDRPDLFDRNVHTVELFHRCGSLIMAYSFSDEREKEEEEQEEEEEEEDEMQPEALAMVPMADMLNHKTGFNNARLFHEPECLIMKTIKPIAAGEQIYNTYGDLCNADLLRKYGFVDQDNPFDLCELNGKEVVDVFHREEEDDETVSRKIDFLMEEGVLDDCFVLDTDHELPPELISTALVLQASDAEFQKMLAKQKLPKPKLTPHIRDLTLQVLRHRLDRYPTSLQDDISTLANASSINQRNALIVRIGEKQILQDTMSKLEAMTFAKDDNKRPGDVADDGKRKKQKPACT